MPKPKPKEKRPNIEQLAVVGLGALIWAFQKDVSSPEVALLYATRFVAVVKEKYPETAATLLALEVEVEDEL